MARELGAENLELLPRTFLAFVSAIRGDEGGRQAAENVVERGLARGFAAPVAVAVYVLGFIELGDGHWEAALERLNTLVDDESGVADHYMGTFSCRSPKSTGLREARGIRCPYVWLGQFGNVPRAMAHLDPR